MHTQLSFEDALVPARIVFCFGIATTGIVLFVRLISRPQPATRTVLVLCIVVSALGLVFGIGDSKFAFAGWSFSSGPMASFRSGVVDAKNDEQLKQVNARHPDGAKEYSDLVQLRVKLRFQLRQIYGKRYGDLPAGKDAGFKELLVLLARDGTIGCPTARQLWEVADKTHFAEWLNEPIPDEQQLNQVNKLGPPLIETLSQIEQDLLDGKLHPQFQQPSESCILPKTQ